MDSSRCWAEWVILGTEVAFRSPILGAALQFKNPNSYVCILVITTVCPSIGQADYWRLNRRTIIPGMTQAKSRVERESVALLVCTRESFFLAFCQADASLHLPRLVDSWMVVDHAISAPIDDDDGGETRAKRLWHPLAYLNSNPYQRPLYE